jgi:hypothetical protein
MAPNSFTIIVASVYKPLLGIIERSMHGGAVTVRQVNPNADEVLKIAKESQNPLVVVHERKGNDDWLNLAKAMHDASPELKTIAFGESTDVGQVARGIVHGVTNYIPLPHGSDLVEIKQVFVNAIAGVDAPVDSMFGRVKAMLPKTSEGVFVLKGSSLSAKEAIQQCLGLGLTAEETAKYLSVEENAVGKLAQRLRRRPLWEIPSGALLKYAFALCVFGFLVQTIPALLRWRTITTVAVSGKVSYRGSPIQTGAIMFVPLGGTKGRVAGAKIETGTYLVTADKGVERGGKYRVEITALRPSGQERKSPMGQGIGFEQFLPTQFNSQSNLVLEVPAGIKQMPADYELNPAAR